MRFAKPQSEGYVVVGAHPGHLFGDRVGKPNDNFVYPTEESARKNTYGEGTQLAKVTLRYELLS